MPQPPPAMANWNGQPAPAPPPPPLPPEVSFTLDLPDLLRALQSEPTRGLTTEQALARRAVHGPNRLRQAPPVPGWRKFLRQFREVVVVILIAAAILSALLGDLADAGAILAIVILNALIGHWQEQRAEQALAALARLSAPMAKVLRGGEREMLPAAELVPGDVIVVEAGDHVPADARLLTAYGLQVQESSLTGESAPVPKQPGGPLPETTPLGDRTTLLFLGTIVTTGQAEAVVTATGMDTQLGHIAGLLGSAENEPTPLQRRLAGLGRVLVGGCLAIVLVVFLLEYRRTGELGPVLVRAISLAVAAVPEGLPAVVTLTLALGLKRMVGRNVLIRRLPSVETLGSVTVICSDKTGTLTRNEMTVTTLYAGGEWFHVTGEGYQPVGELLPAPQPSPATRQPREATAGPSSHHTAVPGGTVGFERDESLPSSAPQTTAALREAALARHPALWQTLETAYHCHHARLLAPTDENPAWRVMGDPTEGALLVAGLKAGFDQQIPPGRVVHELPFDSTRKAMSLVHRTPDGGLLMFTKGAPEMLLPQCTRVVTAGGLAPLDDAGRQQILAAAARMAGQALRVLALARRSCPDQPFESLAEEELTFCGLAGLIDPARREAAEAVARCRSAGIRPVMITGDHPVTATAIARALAIAGPDDQTLDGSQLDRLSDEQLLEQVVRTPVYARVSPVHKLRVVKAWRARGQIVAMTGDGVNDAPAVQAADIGVAMGITGTDVTKAASDMVLTDDNFASIVAAVEEGRGIFANIRKFIHFLLACNTGEVLLMFLAALLGWPAPLQPIHLLWINLVTDGLPALALALEPPERDIMRQPPRPPAEPVISRRDGVRIFAQGLLQAVICLLGFWWVGGPSATGEGSRRAESVVFACAALCQLSMAMASRSPTRTTPQLGWLTNRALLAAVACSALLQVVVMHIPLLDRMLKTTAPGFSDWLLIFALALIPVTMIEVSKLVFQFWHGSARSGEPPAPSMT